MVVFFSGVANYKSSKVCVVLLIYMQDTTEKWANPFKRWTNPVYS